MCIRDRAFRNHTHIEKIRIAKFVTQTINSNIPEISAHDGRMNTILGLLEKGDKNCAGEEFTNDLFGGEAKQGPTTADLHRNPRPANETTGRGIVPTEAEKQKAEEEARKRKEAEEAEAEEQRRLQEEEEARKKKENSMLNRLWRSIKKFSKTVMEEEE